jgi:asparagine synthase (glutamine-hydrolysing)
MCGINGYISFSKKLDLTKVVESMNAATKHRGPDAEGIYVDSGVGLGHVRLSIIDLNSTSNQPMYSSSNDYVLTYNGEIYNYKELKKELSEYDFQTNSDSEVIIAAYQKWGEKCLSRLNGMFSFVIYDKQNKSLFVARDRYGVKPFYYFFDGTSFVFSSEIKGILSTKIIDPVLNEAVFYDFVVFNRTDHLENTCFDQIKNLRPGNCIKINLEAKQVDVVKWYTLPQEHLFNGTLKDMNAEVLESVKDSVKMHLVGDVAIGSALSGGLDSSIIVSLLRDIEGDGRVIHTFSAVYDENWGRDERVYIEEVVNRKNLSSNFVFPDEKRLLKDIDKLIYQQEEPFASASLFASWCVYSEASKKNIKVLLNGQGADELFAYDYMAAFYFHELFKQFKWMKLIKEVFQFNKKQLDVLFTMKLFAFLLVPKSLKNRLINVSDLLVSKTFFKKYQGQSSFYTDFFSVNGLNDSVRKHLQMKLNHLLRVEDKNSMMFGVEGRVPFLEMNLVKVALSIPSEFKVRNGEVKYILKNALKNFLPKLIYNRTNKIGYETPMDKWMRSDVFIDELNKLLNEPFQPMEKYLNLKHVRKCWEDHCDTKKNYSPIIWKYFYLTKWYNIYFK